MLCSGSPTDWVAHKKLRFWKKCPLSFTTAETRQSSIFFHRFYFFLPNTALARRIHSRSHWTVISLGEILRIGERTDNADYSRRVHWASDLCKCILGSHGAAPDLGVVEEEKLVVGEIEPRQICLLTMKRHPLFVSPKALFQATIIGDVLSCW